MKKREKAILLRLQGKTYREICSTLHVPSKSILSYWFKNLQLPEKVQTKIKQQVMVRSMAVLNRYNRLRTKAIVTENATIMDAAGKEIGKLTKHELLLVGTALYWGEGTKSENNKTRALELSNSDPELIRLFLRFVREILGVPEEKIRAGIQVHHNVQIDDAKKYWAKVTRLPKNRFYILKQVSSASRSKRPGRRLPYGTARIVINNRGLFYRIKGYIKALSVL